MNALRLAVVLAAISCGASQAVAESPACAPLQSNYLALLKASASTGAQDTTALRRKLSDLTVQAQQGNCNRFLFFGPPKSPACPAIAAGIAQLRQQLAAAMGGGGLFSRSPDEERAFLQDALQQNGCTVPSLSTSGRTLCVRTCDGYYFPLNYRVSASRVKTDAATCQAMYGGEPTAASLFVQKGDDVADARSPDGKQRYGDQVYAFLYRQTYNPACHTLLKDGMATFEASALARHPPAEEPPVAISDVEPAGGALQAISAIQQPENAKRSVRFVGSAYYETLFAYGEE
jgi:hypothetical protein